MNKILIIINQGYDNRNNNSYGRNDGSDRETRGVSDRYDDRGVDQNRDGSGNRQRLLNKVYI